MYSGRRFSPIGNKKMSTTYNSSLDAYRSSVSGTEVIGRKSVAITPSDTVDLAAYPKAIVVTAAGNLVVLPLMAADDGSHTITFTAAVVGFVLPFRVRRVLATGTSASVATIDD
jgi:hypothetical protein